LLSERSGSTGFDVVWETNRGCLYSCNFCDWGSNTMSKVRKFDMERVKAEIDWFARMNVNAIILADANFGILPRDLEIADILNEARSKLGHPKFVHYSPAKNNPERTVEIARKFAASGISPVHPFAIQHTNVEVLAAADRANISADKQRQIAKAVVTEHIPTLVQLIIGIPGDTYDLWKTCLTDLMDWGLHDNYQIFNYTLLPNAPAAEKSFRHEWEVETITRDVPQEGTGQRKKNDTDALTRVDIIVQSKSYSRQDWVKMKTYAAFVRALHNRSLTRLIAIYLHFTHGISYREFYDRIIEDYFGRSSLYKRLTEHFVRFLTNESAFEDVAFDPVPESSLYVEPSQWLFLQICSDFDQYFEQLRSFLMDCFPRAENLASAVDYQRNLILAPSVGQKRDKSFHTDFDWIQYFEKAATLTQYEPLAEPAAIPGAVIEVLDDLSEFEGSPRNPRDRRLAWVELVREVRRTLNTNFQRLRFRTAHPQQERT
jgi:2-(S-pantetheinyl)-carbapenam-3-carboxylate methyltransferase